MTKIHSYLVIWYILNSMLKNKKKENITVS